MFGKLRVKFVLLSTGILTLVLLLVISLVYMLAAGSLEGQIAAIVDAISNNGGVMPTNTESDRKAEENSSTSAGSSSHGFVPYGEIYEDLMSSEMRYEARYFSVWLDESGEVADVNINSIALVKRGMAEYYSRSVMSLDAGRGYISSDNRDITYAFRKNSLDDGTTLIVFVDCTSRLWVLNLILMYMCGVAFSVLLIFLLLMIHLSKRAVQPYIENAEKQKQFITNASHELKTPLAVISANTEMIEMLNGSSKWTDSTMRQVKRMSALVGELVTISRLNERDEVVLSDVNLTEIVKESADSYRQVVLTQGKQFESDIEEDIHVKGDARALTEISNILLDNAAKYCDDSGTVKISLSKRAVGKGVRLAVSNDYAEGTGVDFSRFFERFYRQDESHSSKKQGYGIGLSMGQAIAEKLGANLHVSYKQGIITFMFDV